MKTVRILLCIGILVVFAGCRHADVLAHKLEIYIPSTVEANREFKHDDVVKKTLQLFAQEFGGSSSLEIQGCWISRDGKALFEKGTVCFVYCSGGKLDNGKKLLRELAAKMRTALHQEVVAIVIDGTMEFI